MTAHGLLPPSIYRLLNASKVLCSSVLMPVLTPTCWDSADYQPAFFQIHASLTASFETSSLRSEAESSGAAAPWAGWGERQVPCNSNEAEWASRKSGISEISAPRGPLTTVSRLLLSVGSYTRHRDHRGRKGLAVQHGSFSRPCTPGEQESRSARNTNPPVAPTPALVSPMGYLPEPREARRRLPEKDLAGEPSGHAEHEKAAHCEVMGRQLYFYTGSLRAARMREPQCQAGTAEGTICERGHEEDQGRRWGLYLTSFPPRNFNRITVSPAKQRQDWSTARWGAEVITAVTAHPITSATVVPKDSGGLSICWHRSIVTVIVTPQKESVVGRMPSIRWAFHQRILFSFQLLSCRQFCVRVMLTLKIGKGLDF